MAGGGPWFAAADCDGGTALGNGQCLQLCNRGCSRRADLEASPPQRHEPRWTGEVPVCAGGSAMGAVILLEAIQQSEWLLTMGVQSLWTGKVTGPLRTSPVYGARLLTTRSRLATIGFVG